MAASGRREDGDQEHLVLSGETGIPGRMPTNTDGGLVADGEPIGASRRRQVHELVLQSRGEAGPRHVSGYPRAGFAQVYGARGVSCCAVLTG